jgi:hypothetical protein
MSDRPADCVVDPRLVERGTTDDVATLAAVARAIGPGGT